MKNDSKWLRYGLPLLLLNAGYLLSRDAPTLFYAGNVLLHVVGGAAITLLAFRALESRASRAVLAVVIVTGAALTVAGYGTSTRWLWTVHVVIALVAAVTIVHALRTHLAGAALVLGVTLPLAAWLSRPSAPSLELNAALAPVSMAGEAMGGADGPFFPSSAETTHGGTIPSRFFLESEKCGRCHTDIYKEWQSSAHRRASFNNQWYRKSVEYMQSVVGVTPSKWCGGCHDHALLFSGMMDEPIAELIDLPEAHAGLSCTSCHSIVRVKNTMGNGGFVLDYPPLYDLATSDNPVVRAVHDFILHLDPEPHRKTFLKPLHEGDSSAFCSSCHKVHLDVPVNSYRWLRGFNSYDNWQASGVSGEGARSFYYPEEPATCTTCHMPEVPGYDPAAPSGLLRSHRFAAANTALPVAYRDAEQLEAVEAFLRAGQVSVDLFALVRSEAEAPARQDLAAPTIASTFAVGEEAEMTAPARMTSVTPEESMMAPLDETASRLVRGESVRLDAVVRTRKVGHFFPSGTVDAFDVWLEVKGTDETGRTFFWSGRAEDDGKGPVEPGAHFYRSVLIDAKGQPINKRNAWAARSTVYAQLIPPGAANTVRFRVEVPEDIGDRVRFEAKLNYRKFAWWHTQWAYAGVREEGVTPDVTESYDLGVWTFDGDTSEVSGEVKAIPDVPIVTMAEASVTLEVVDALPEDAADLGVADASSALRWNDYGIGLLLQGDLKAAEKAFRRVTEADPSYADGFVNVARVRVQEGDPDGAREALDEALALDPDLAKSHYFYGLVLKTEGKYDEALDSFRRAAARYPRDRVVRNQIGRLHFLKREYDQAIAELEKTLRIDPEDLEAHYNLMLAYQGKGDMELASQHRELYLRFKADEASQFLTGDYRRENPEDNNERLPIHEHRNVTDR